MTERDADRTLEALARDRGADLVAYASLLTGGDRAGAQDLVQDAIVKVFGRMRAGFTPDVAEAYVRRTILTLYVDGFRRRRGWSAVRHLVAAPDAGPPPQADHLDLRAALRDLAPQERVVVVLRYYEDLTVADVAARMGLAEGTVKRYLSNALGKLNARLGTEVDPADADVAEVTAGTVGMPRGPRVTSRRTTRAEGNAR